MSEYYLVRMPPDMPYEIQAELNAWYIESEPIVRCRDCEHAVHFFPWVTPSRRSKVEVWTCRLAAEGLEIEPDGFCAWGERKDKAICEEDHEGKDR